ncbi:LysR family transcriptional regulator [Piscinibacter sakaiensis]|uniref:LysR family transcriptional regulator n=1 Tax=Piscinibacter sakaiensis TaxID=1547922 RepID=UPI003AAABA1D
MDASRLPWQDLQFFLATARDGTLAGAAQTLETSSATVHRRLAKLERCLAATLFVRSPRGYALTAAGRQLLAHLQRVDAEIVAAQRRLSGIDNGLSGAVRIATVDDLAIDILSGLLRDFSQRHPQVTLELTVGSGRTDLARRQADVAIRPGSRPTEGDVIPRHICAVGVAMYASRSYLERHGRPQRADSWHRHRIVRADRGMAALPMEVFIDRYTSGSHAVFRSDAMLVRQAAVRQGLGIGLLPCFSADADATLVRISDVIPEASAMLWIVVHADLRRNARVRSFVEFADAALRQLQPRFEGRVGAGAASSTTPTARSVS